MTLTQLKIFIAVVEHGSFRSAATAVFKTQSAVSASIRKLEDELSSKFFERDTYRPTLTSAGEVFYRQAKPLLLYADKLKQTGLQMGTGIEEQINISINSVCPLQHVLESIKPSIGLFQNTHFNFSVAMTEDVMQFLQKGLADFAFSPYLNLDNGFEYRKIFRLTMINVAVPDFFTKGSIDDDFARRYSQIVIPRGAIQPANKTSSLNGVGPNNYVVNDFSAKKELILAGLGWGVMPKHLIDGELKSKALIPIQMKGINEITTESVYLIRNSSAVMGTVAQNIWDTFLPENQHVSLSSNEQNVVNLRHP